MWRVWFFFLFVFILPVICFADDCDMYKDGYLIVTNPSIELWTIVLSGKNECLEDFLKKYHYDKDILNRIFSRDECPNCTGMERDNYYLSSKTCDGETPLTCLTKFHDLPMIKKLVEAGADVNKPNLDGDTPLIISVSTNKSFNINEMDLMFDSALNKFDLELANAFGADNLIVSGYGKTLDANPVLRIKQANRTDIDIENYLTYSTILDGGDVYNDIVKYLLDKGADVNAVNNNGENSVASAFDSYRFPLNISQDIFLELLHKSRLNDSVYKYNKYTVPMRAYCWGMSSSMNLIIDELFKAGYDINKKSEDGKTFCDIVNYDDFVRFNCPEIECNTQNKGKIQPCAMPNGVIQITDGCENDKKNGTKICDGTKWSECSLERGNNKCRYYTEVCDCTSEAKKTDPNVIQADKQKNTGKCEIKSCADGYDISENKDKCINNGNVNQHTSNNEKKGTALQEAKAREQSIENRTLSALTVAVTGIGGMQLAQGLAEQKADKEADQDMSAYIASFRCEYGDGKQVKGGPDEIELPGGNDETLLKYRNEYIALAADLKERKEALGMKPGIESEVILDKAQIGLYDNESTGITGGAYSSLYRAKMLDSEIDQTKIDEDKEKSEKRVIAGGVLSGVGVAGGMIGNSLINGKLGEMIKDSKNTTSKTNTSVINKLKKGLKSTGMTGVDKLDFSNLDLSSMSSIIDKIDFSSMSGLKGKNATDILNTSNSSSFTSSFSDILGNENMSLFQ